MTKEIKINGNPIIQTTILPDESTFKCKNCDDFIQKGKTYFYDESGSFCSVKCYKDFNHKSFFSKDSEIPFSVKKVSFSCLIGKEYKELIKWYKNIQVSKHPMIKFHSQGEFIEFLIQYCLDENIITLKNQEQNNNE